MIDSSFTTMSEAMLAVVADVLDYGKDVAPRGLPTREVLGQSFEITDAVRCGLPVKIGRKVAMRLAAIEGAQNLAGRSHAELAVRTSPALAKFANILEHPPDCEGDEPVRETYFHGSYARRLRDQIQRCEQQLRDDPSTRQAIISMWDESDRSPVWNDRPCCTELQFMIRSDGLHLFAYYRANDAWKGFAYDVYQFVQLQAAMANVLCIDTAAYHHYASSMHLYEDEIERAEALKPDDGVDVWDVNDMIAGAPWDVAGKGSYRSMAEVQHRFVELMNFCYHGEVPWEPANPVEAWYVQKLRDR